MENGFYIVDQILPISVDDQSILAVLDGKEIQSMDDFYTAFSKQFSFPDYFGENTEAFYELMNDLDWLEKTAYIIHIKNYDQLLQNDQEDKLMCLEMLYQCAIEWQQVPNYEGEDEYRLASDFKIYVEKNSNILSDLKMMEITEGVYVS